MGKYTFVDAVDCANGITYLGKIEGDRLRELFLGNFMLVPTQSLSSGNYQEAVREIYRKKISELEYRVIKPIKKLHIVSTNNSIKVSLDNVKIPDFLERYCSVEE